MLGTCSRCHRKFAVVDGVIAYHQANVGYPCYGSGKAPAKETK